MPKALAQVQGTAANGKLGVAANVPLRERLASSGVESPKPCDRLVLGTAQFGLNYGIANVIGQPNARTVRRLVLSVWERGVRFFDTAQSYGASEAALGSALASHSLNSEACVITKLKLENDGRETAAVLHSIEGSLERLKVQRLWGLLVHDETQLAQWHEVWGPMMDEARRAGLIGQVGISVYSPQHAKVALETEGLDIIQVPANVFDRRMLRAGVFDRARELGKTVFIRSVYLQGLVTMEPTSIPRSIPGARAAIAAFRQFCAEHQLDDGEFAVDHVRHQAPLARMIIGSETVAQATENCARLERSSFDEKVHHAWTARCPADDPVLIDPRGWNTAK